MQTTFQIAEQYGYSLDAFLIPEIFQPVFLDVVFRSELGEGFFADIVGDECGLISRLFRASTRHHLWSATAFVHMTAP